MIEPWLYVALTATAVLTGFIDAIAGGGGLIMMPALLSAGVPPVQALATNKLQSMFGTGTACFNYWRKGLVDWRANVLTIVLVAAGASAGVGRRDRRLRRLLRPWRGEFLHGVIGRPEGPGSDPGHSAYQIVQPHQQRRLGYLLRDRREDVLAARPVHGCGGDDRRLDWKPHRHAVRRRTDPAAAGHPVAGLDWAAAVGLFRGLTPAVIAA